MRISKKILVTMIVPLLAVFLFASEGLAQKKGFDDKEIRIGSWSPQTGPAAPWGATSRGAKLLFDIVNEQGGIHGRQLRLFIRDDQYNPSQTMAGVRDLVDRQGVLAFVGGVGTAPALAVRRYLAQNKIPLVSVMTGAEHLNFPHNPWLWALWPLYDDDASVMAKFLVEKKKFKKIGMLYQNDDYGLDPLAGVQRRLKTYNMELAIAVPVEPIERDLSSQISRLKAAGVEAVIGYVAPTQAAIALRSSVAIGFRPQWIHSYNLTDFSLMNHITDGLWAKEGVMTTAFTEDILDFKIPKMKEYADAAKRLAPGERWGIFYAAGITAGEPLVQALKQVGRDLSPEALVRELNNINNFQGIGPRVTWTATNHLPPAEFRIWQCGPKGEVIVLQDWTKNDLPKKR
ncbi:MAG: amino acid/amide ABC transporter substrate-binding protein HAAT family [Syntrophaceae bacterium]|nr:MAG: amino acid/amide ABC transporter substrate-binding protein HAAT family [Syntrophaceae bacterium]